MENAAGHGPADFEENSCVCGSEVGVSAADNKEPARHRVAGGIHVAIVERGTEGAGGCAEVIGVEEGFEGTSGCPQVQAIKEGLEGAGGRAEVEAIEVGLERARRCPEVLRIEECLQGSCGAAEVLSVEVVFERAGRRCKESSRAGKIARGIRLDGLAGGETLEDGAGGDE